MKAKKKKEERFVKRILNREGGQWVDPKLGERTERKKMELDLVELCTVLHIEVIQSVYSMLKEGILAAYNGSHDICFDKKAQLFTYSTRKDGNVLFLPDRRMNLSKDSLGG